jgi:hypothetical protein
MLRGKGVKLAEIELKGWFKKGLCEGFFSKEQDKVLHTEGAMGEITKAELPTPTSPIRGGKTATGEPVVELEDNTTPDPDMHEQSHSG